MRPALRRGRALVALLPLAVPIGCERAVSLPPAGEDTLVLELGGPHRPLGEALRAIAGPARGSGAPPERVAPVQRQPVQRQPVQPPDPVQPPEPEPERTALLGRGQTVYGLANEHLGAGARWREILALNGWTEAEARALPAGTRVRLPAR